MMLQCAALSQDDLGDSQQFEQSASATHSALTHPLTYVLSHCACLPSFCLFFTLNPIVHFFTVISPPWPQCIHLFIFSTLPFSLTFLLTQPSFLLCLISHSSPFTQAYPGGPWWAAGDDSCISSRLRGHFRSAPLRLNSTVWATVTKGEEDEGVVREIGERNIYGKGRV